MFIVSFTPAGCHQKGDSGDFAVHLAVYDLKIFFMNTNFLSVRSIAIKKTKNYSSIMHNETAKLCRGCFTLRDTTWCHEKFTFHGHERRKKNEVLQSDEEFSVIEWEKLEIPDMFSNKKKIDGEASMDIMNMFSPNNAVSERNIKASRFEAGQSLCSHTFSILCGDEKFISLFFFSSCEEDFLIW